MPARLRPSTSSNGLLQRVGRRKPGPLGTSKTLFTARSPTILTTIRPTIDYDGLFSGWGEPPTEGLQWAGSIRLVRSREPNNPRREPNARSSLRVNGSPTSTRNRVPDYLIQESTPPGI